MSRAANRGAPVPCRPTEVASCWQIFLLSSLSLRGLPLLCVSVFSSIGLCSLWITVLYYHAFKAFIVQRRPWHLWIFALGNSAVSWCRGCERKSVKRYSRYRLSVLVRVSTHLESREKTIIFASTKQGPVRLCWFLPLKARQSWAEKSHIEFTYSPLGPSFAQI